MASETAGLRLRLASTGSNSSLAGLAMKSSSRSELEKYIRHLFMKTVLIVVQSRQGQLLKSRSNASPTGQSWFGIDLPESPDITHETKKAINNCKSVSSGSELGHSTTFLSQFSNSGSMCVEISLTTAEGDSMVLESWLMYFLPDTTDPVCQDESSKASPEPDMKSSNINHIYSQMSLLLKSVLCITRSLPSYQLSQTQGVESHVICYRIFQSGNILELTDREELLGPGWMSINIGQINLGHVFDDASLSLTVNYRTSMVMNESGGAPNKPPNQQKLPSASVENVLLSSPLGSPSFKHGEHIPTGKYRLSSYSEDNISISSSGDETGAELKLFTADTPIQQYMDATTTTSWRFTAQDDNVTSSPKSRRPSSRSIHSSSTHTPTTTVSDKYQFGAFVGLTREASDLSHKNLHSEASSFNSNQFFFGGGGGNSSSLGAGGVGESSNIDTSRVSRTSSDMDGDVNPSSSNENSTIGGGSKTKFGGRGNKNKDRNVSTSLFEVFKFDSGEDEEDREGGGRRKEEESCGLTAHMDDAIKNVWNHETRTTRTVAPLSSSDVMLSTQVNANSEQFSTPFAVSISPPDSVNSRSMELNRVCHSRMRSSNSQQFGRDNSFSRDDFQSEGECGGFSGSNDDIHGGDTVHDVFELGHFFKTISTAPTLLSAPSSTLDRRKIILHDSSHSSQINESLLVSQLATSLNLFEDEPKSSEGELTSQKLSTFLLSSSTCGGGDVIHQKEMSDSMLEVRKFEDTCQAYDSMLKNMETDGDSDA